MPAVTPSPAISCSPFRPKNSTYQSTNMKACASLLGVLPFTTLDIGCICIMKLVSFLSESVGGGLIGIGVTTAIIYPTGSLTGALLTVSGTALTTIKFILPYYIRRRRHQEVAVATSDLVGLVAQGLLLIGVGIVIIFRPPGGSLAGAVFAVPGAASLISSMWLETISIR